MNSFWIEVIGTVCVTYGPFILAAIIAVVERKIKNKVKAHKNKVKR